LLPHGDRRWLRSMYFNVTSPVSIVIANRKPTASAVKSGDTELNSISLKVSSTFSSALGMVVLEILDRMPFRRSSVELKYSITWC
jgi:hypothetical protein